MERERECQLLLFKEMVEGLVFTHEEKSSKLNLIDFYAVADNELAHQLIACN